MKTYDTIIIGSGAGGLTAGLALAREGQRVLICEQHEVPGGWMHSFNLNGYSFNTGVHYIGEMGPGERFHTLLDRLGVLKYLDIIEINPDGYDHILIGDLRFDIPKGETSYKKRLQSHFPHEKDGIDKLFTAIRGIYNGLQAYMDANHWGIVKSPALLRWMFCTGQSLINHHVRDPMLRAILLSQCGNHAMPPSQVSAITHSAIMWHYINGAYHPVGGGKSISKAYMRAFKEAGGELRLSTSVSRIMIDRSKAIGVRVATGEEILANHVVSNADPHTTFQKLIEQAAISKRLQRRLAHTTYTTSCLSLYLVLDIDLTSAGFDSGNYWIYESPDIDLHYRNALTSYNAYHDPGMMFVTATSLKDSKKMRKEFQQVEVFALTAYDMFDRWKRQPSGERDDAYKQLKSDIMDRLLNVLGRRFPQIPATVKFRDLGTPLTNAHYINAHRGNMYGCAKTIGQTGLFGYPISTEIEGLYLCGASTLAHGVAYSANTGMLAAAKILNRRASSFYKLNLVN